MRQKRKKKEKQEQRFTCSNSKPVSQQQNVLPGGVLGSTPERGRKEGLPKREAEDVSEADGYDPVMLAQAQ